MLLGYVREYGGIGFDETPINYIDLLALATLSNFEYPDAAVGLTLRDALPLATEPTIPQFGKDGRATGDHIVALSNKEDAQLAELVCNSPRYRDVRVFAFRSAYREGAYQFGAIAYRIGDIDGGDLLVVAFRGTDKTVTGWNEALSLSLDERVGGQSEAISFLKKVLRESAGDGESEAETGSGGCPVVVCGHSKGGNLAEYSSTVAVEDSSEVADRIAAIVSFDGPGLPPWMRKLPAYHRIAPRIRTFIPKSSIIGNIHEHPDGAVVYIDSEKAFTDQHFVYNWITRGTQFVPVDQSLAGRTGSFALNLLIDNLNDRQKKGIFKALFAVPRALGRQTLSGK